MNDSVLKCSNFLNSIFFLYHIKVLKKERLIAFRGLYIVVFFNLIRSLLQTFIGSLPLKNYLRQHKWRTKVFNCRADNKGEIKKTQQRQLIKGENTGLLNQRRGRLRRMEFVHKAINLHRHNSGRHKFRLFTSSNIHDRTVRSLDFLLFRREGIFSVLCRISEEKKCASAELTREIINLSAAIKTVSFGEKKWSIMWLVMRM